MTRFTGRWMKGLEVHAHMLAQQLDGRMPRADPGLGAVARRARCASPPAALTGALELRGWRLALALARPDRR